MVNNAEDKRQALNQTCSKGEKHVGQMLTLVCLRGECNF